MIEMNVNVNGFLKPEFEAACRIGLELPPPPFLEDDAVSAFPIAWGWYHKLRRTAQASVVLHEEGYSNERAPLLRLLVEFASAIHWMADDRDAAAERVHKSSLNDVQRRRDAASKVGVPIDEAKFAEVLASQVSDANKHLDVFLNAKQRLDRPGLALPHHGLVYLTESHYSRPTYDAAAEFLMEHESGDWTPVTEPKAEHPVGRYTFCTEMVLVGAQGVSQLMIGNPWEREVAELIEACQVKLLEATEN